MKFVKFLPVILLVCIIGFFYSPFLLHGKLPIPADTIVGLYHPFRDLYAKQYPNGIPYKNSLITDPVRQQYPWRNLSISLEKQLVLPLWNPYNAAGAPLLATIQSAPLYPLNLVFFFARFPIAWSGLILLQQLLAGIFMFLYLNNLKLRRSASFLGGFVFAFCGFFIAWLEWGTVIQTALWLPLILLAKNKIFIKSLEQITSISAARQRSHAQTRRSNPVKGKKKRKVTRSVFVSQASISSLPFRTFVGFRIATWFWSILFLFAFICSFLAGHLQLFFYVFLCALAYFLARWWQYGKSKKVFLLFVLLASCFVILTIVQWLPLLQFIQQSGRDVDQLNNWQKAGWFIPWQHLAQFIVPDFFGNPTTLNYWGVWNYGELVGYIGLFPLFLALFALFFRRDRKTLFFGTLFFLALLFSLPTRLGQLPFVLHIPLISTAQPTRLLFLIDFCLAVLAAFGADYYLRVKNKKHMFYPLGFLLAAFILVWGYIIIGQRFSLQISPVYLATAKRNLYLPTILMILIFCVVSIDVLLKPRIKIPKKWISLSGQVPLLVLIALTIFDLIRFSQKFTPFTDQNYLFPQTKALTFLQKHSGNQRIMTTDSEILPPNFSIMYHLQSLDDYDPLYLRRYGELIAASERGKPDIAPPFGFNRIITPHQFDSQIIDLAGVKYVLSLSDITSPKLKKVFTEGQTRVYQNTSAFPRAFFVQTLTPVKTKQQDINQLFRNNLRTTATVELQKRQSVTQLSNFSQGKAVITHYYGDRITIQTTTAQTGFLVLSDTYYPTWHAKVCDARGQNCQQTAIYLTDYTFRGIVVLPGKHMVIFYDILF